MLIRNIKEFLKLTMNKRIISLDIGKSKIGSAISDQNHLIVTPLNVFPRKKICTELYETIQEFNAGGILVGPDGQNLQYDIIDKILNPYFLVACSSHWNNLWINNQD